MPRPYVLGLLGEYLGRLFRTVNRKPQLLIREVVLPAAEHPPVAAAPP
jgi:undecaprenyl-phosphate 4-deoxy-4-formamido-L-arabinose transferase